MTSNSESQSGVSVPHPFQDGSTRAAPLSLGDAKVVIAGDALADTSYLRGYNTFYIGRAGQITTRMLPDVTTAIVAGVCGVVDVVEKIVSVRGLSPRYIPEIGDVVVGRILEVTGKRWRCDLGGHHDATMLLSNVTQPGGLLRRRGRGDELSMRSIFTESDLFVAEVQRISPEGGAGLHTRSAERFGKLSGAGQLVVVRPSLVQRVRRHFHVMVDLGVSIVLGVNGWVWVGRATAQQLAEAAAAAGAEEQSSSAGPEMAAPAGPEGTEVAATASTTLDHPDEAEIRRSIARVANIVRVFDTHKLAVSPAAIEASAGFSLTRQMSAFDVLSQGNAELIVADAAARRHSLTGAKRPREV